MIELLKAGRSYRERGLSGPLGRIWKIIACGKGADESVYVVHLYIGVRLQPMTRVRLNTYRNQKEFSDAWADVELMPPSVKYLQSIDKPFALLDEDVQLALQREEYRGHIEILIPGSYHDESHYQWIVRTKDYSGAYDVMNVYRLSPSFRKKETKKMTVAEIAEKLGYDVEIIKG